MDGCFILKANKFSTHRTVPVKFCKANNKEIRTEKNNSQIYDYLHILKHIKYTVHASIQFHCF